MLQKKLRLLDFHYYCCTVSLSRPSSALHGRSCDRNTAAIVKNEERDVQCTAASFECVLILGGDLLQRTSLFLKVLRNLGGFFQWDKENYAAFLTDWAKYLAERMQVVAL